MIRQTQDAGWLCPRLKRLYILFEMSMDEMNGEITSCTREQGGAWTATLYGERGCGAWIIVEPKGSFHHILFH